MPTALTIIFVGCTVFLSHYFAALFARTKIPDALWLFTIGLLLGPIGRVTGPENFGAVGPVFTTITLIFILFGSGIDQHLEPLIHSLSGTAKITTYNFVGTCLVAGQHSLLQHRPGPVARSLAGQHRRRHLVGGGHYPDAGISDE